MDAVRRGRAQAAEKVIRLTPEHGLQRAAKRFLNDAAAAQCPKCGSPHVGREPAFLRCRCCGKLARIADASLSAQTEFELRSGLRIAS
jgi:ribosomal protein L37AE/L43A